MKDFLYAISTGVIGGLISGAFFHFLQTHLQDRSRKMFFQELKKPDNWTSLDSQHWIHKQKPEFTIERLEEEDLAPINYNNYPFPDNNHNKRITVKFKVMNHMIEETYFMSLDGGRYLVPLTRFGYSSEEATLETQYIYWDSNHYDFDLFKIIGSMYQSESLDSFAKRVDIQVCDGI